MASDYSPGLEGVIAFETEIAEPDKDGGSLRYRGVDIEDLVGRVTFGNVWALLVDGKLVAAVEEERFNRIKHGKEASFDNPHQLPERSVRYCLKAAGLTAKDIDHVGYSFDPKRRVTMPWLYPARSPIAASVVRL